MLLNDLVPRLKILWQGQLAYLPYFATLINHILLPNIYFWTLRSSLWLTLFWGWRLFSSRDVMKRNIDFGNFNSLLYFNFFLNFENSIELKETWKWMLALCCKTCMADCTAISSWPLTFRCFFSFILPQEKKMRGRRDFEKKACLEHSDWMTPPGEQKPRN